MRSSRRAGIPPYFPFLILTIIGFAASAAAQGPLLHWADHYGGGGNVYVLGLAVDQDNSIIMTGDFDDTVVFGGFPCQPRKQRYLSGQDQLGRRGALEPEFR